MKRLSEILEKQIPRTFSSKSLEQQLIDNYGKDWSIQKQPLLKKTKWDMIRASVVLQGVSNKIAIEKAYIRIMDGMENYWSVLDYQERVRILNIDLLPLYQALPTFTVSGTPIVIPFFDERFNEIYQKEMVVFSLKQYQYMMHTYQQWIRPIDHYGLAYFNGTFVPTKLIHQEENNYVLYHPDLYSFFALIDSQELVFPLFDQSCKPFILSEEQLAELSKKLLSKDVLSFLEYGVEQNIFSTKAKNAVLKKHQKKQWFSL